MRALPRALGLPAKAAAAPSSATSRGAQEASRGRPPRLAVQKSAPRTSAAPRAKEQQPSPSQVAPGRAWLLPPRPGRRWRRPRSPPAPHLGCSLRQSPFRWYLQRCSRPHCPPQPAPWSWHSRTGVVAITTDTSPADADPTSAGRWTTVNRCASRSTSASCSAVGRPNRRRRRSPCSRQPPLAHRACRA